MSANNLPKEILFKQVFELHFDRVVSYIYYYCKEWETARNIAQDCFVTLWENMHTLDTSKTILPYLLFIAKNKTLNNLKRSLVNDKFKNYVQKRETELRFIALECSVSENINVSEIEKIIAHSMEQMNSKVKDTFYLSRYKNLKNEEVARELGVSVKTVEYRMAQALRLLKKNLKDYLIMIFF